MTTLPDRLRYAATSRPGGIFEEAADEIERLRAQLHLAEVVRASQVEGLTQGAAGWRERANQLEAEVAGLREDAERGRYMIAHGGWYRSDEQTRMAVLVPRGSDLSCYATREAAIDAALAARKGEA